MHIMCQWFFGSLIEFYFKKLLSIFYGYGFTTKRNFEASDSILIFKRSIWNKKSVNGKTTWFIIPHKSLNFYIKKIIFFLCFQIADLCTVATATSGSESPQLLVDGEDKIDNSESENPNSNSIPLSSSNQSGSELICLDESTTSQMDFGGITLDNFELVSFTLLPFII